MICCAQVLQYVPGGADVEDEDEDAVVVSRLQFVDAPGSEKLATDPEVLRMREGHALNRSVLALGNVVRALSNQATVELANAGERASNNWPSLRTKMTRVLLRIDPCACGCAYEAMVWDLMLEGGWRLASSGTVVAFLGSRQRASQWS